MTSYLAANIPFLGAMSALEVWFFGASVRIGKFIQFWSEARRGKDTDRTPGRGRGRRRRRRERRSRSRLDVRMPWKKKV